MELKLSAPKIWLFSEPVDFRKAIDGLSAIVSQHLTETLGDQLFVFYNRGRNKVKILARHRQGMVLIYKRFEKKRLTVKRDTCAVFELNATQLSWLLAGLDWVALSDFPAGCYQDYF